MRQIAVVGACEVGPRRRGHPARLAGLYSLVATSEARDPSLRLPRRCVDTCAGSPDQGHQRARPGAWAVMTGDDAASRRLGRTVRAPVGTVCRTGAQRKSAATCNDAKWASPELFQTKPPSKKAPGSFSERIARRKKLPGASRDAARVARGSGLRVKNCCAKRHAPGSPEVTVESSKKAVRSPDATRVGSRKAPGSFLTTHVG